MRRTRAETSLISVFILFFGMVFCAAILHHYYAMAVSSEYEDDGSTHIISIHDGSNMTNIRSDADTVRDVLARANVSLGSGDKVEPALDEEIVSDSFNINIYRARNLVVVDGNHKKQIRTASTNPQDIASDAGIEMLEADTLELVPYDNLLESGNTVAYSVKRAKVVNINFYGSQISVRTQKKTVKDLLAEREIDTNAEKNWFSISLDEKISDGMSFTIQPQGIQTITVEEDINFGEKTIQDYDTEYGKRVVVKQGEKGRKTVSYEVNMKDGVELSRKVLSEIVTKEPVTQEVKVGMKLNLPSGSHEDWMAAAGIAPSDYGYVNYIISHESSWRPNATNGKYWGLYQTTQARLISDCGADWVNNPVCQLRSATGYAVGRYGSWEKAYNRWRSQGWW